METMNSKNKGTIKPFEDLNLVISYENLKKKDKELSM